MENNFDYYLEKAKDAMGISEADVIDEGKGKKEYSDEQKRHAVKKYMGAHGIDSKMMGDAKYMADNKDKYYKMMAYMKDKYMMEPGEVKKYMRMEK